MDKNRIAGLLSILLILISVIVSSTGLPGATAEIKDIQWSMGPTLRYGLKFVAQAILGDQILIAGGSQAPGCGPDNATDRVWFFNPATQAYENLPNAPKNLSKSGGAAVGQDFYLLGGVLCAEKHKAEGTFSREVWRLSKRDGNWRWENIPSPALLPRLSGSRHRGDPDCRAGRASCLSSAGSPRSVVWSGSLGCRDCHRPGVRYGGAGKGMV